MATPESPFPEDMSIVDKDKALRQAHLRWSEFPGEKTLGGVVRQIMSEEIIISDEDLAEINLDPETNQVYLPPRAEGAIEASLASDPNVVRRRNMVAMRSARTRDHKDPVLRPASKRRRHA